MCFNVFILPRVTPESHVQRAAISKLPAALSIWTVALSEQRPEAFCLTTKHCQIHWTDLSLAPVTLSVRYRDQFL